MKISQVLSVLGLMCFLIFFKAQAFGHESSQENESTSIEKHIKVANCEKLIWWVGNFRPLLLHFPIALIVMAVISELLYFCYNAPLFDQASRFMLIAAAVTSIPTVLTGLAYGHNAQYE